MEITIYLENKYDVLEYIKTRSWGGAKNYINNLNDEEKAQLAERIYWLYENSKIDEYELNEYIWFEYKKESDEFPF